MSFMKGVSDFLLGKVLISWIPFELFTLGLRPYNHQRNAQNMKCEDYSFQTFKAV